MLFPGHFAGGYLATKALLDAAHLSLDERGYGIAMAVGLICSNAPDLDHIYFWAKKKAGLFDEDATHRELASHAPALWLALGGLIYLFSASDFGRAVAIAVVAGSWSHFILDSVEYGVMWLWPFHKKTFSLRKVRHEHPKGASFVRFHIEWFWKVYVRNVTFWLEVAVVIASAIVFFRSNL